MSDDLLKHFFGGFVRLHIMYHADKEAICGVDMIAELRRHGYRIGPGTLYPIFHSLEKSGCLESETEVIGGKRRKNYRLTRSGRTVLKQAREKLRELVGEVVQDRNKMPRKKGRAGV
jgi:PadR family transcriptional regulator, regulatory protein PadR